MASFRQKQEDSSLSSTTPPSGLSPTASHSPPLASASTSQKPAPSTARTFFATLFSRKPTRKTLIAIVGITTTMLLAAILIPTLLLVTRHHGANTVNASNIPGRLGAGSGSYIPSISHTSLEDGDRKTVSTLFYPIRQADCTRPCSVPYMTPTTAQWANNLFYNDEQAGVFDNVTYGACCASKTALDPQKETLVVIEPQVGTSRFVYGGIAQEIASQGFAVLVMDHAGDAGVKEWTSPWGTKANETVKGSVEINPFLPLSAWNSTIDDVVSNRVSDIESLLEKLSDTSFLTTLLPKKDFTLLSTFSATAKSAIIGHGLGGTVAVSLLATNASKFSLAIDLAGTPPLLSSPMTSGTLVYFGLAGNGVNITRASDIHWPLIWPSPNFQLSKATAWTLQNADVFDLSDVPGIVSLGMGKAGVKARGLGVIEEWKAFGAVAQMVRAYCVMEFKDALVGAEMVSGLRQYFMGELVPYRPV